jgi:hypothetical protein
VSIACAGQERLASERSAFQDMVMPWLHLQMAELSTRAKEGRLLFSFNVFREWRWNRLNNMSPILTA